MRMQLSTLKVGLIPFFLLSCQAFAQIAREPSGIGDFRKPLTERELDLLDQKGLLPIPEAVSEEAFVPFEARESLEVRHANGLRQASGERAQLLELGDIAYIYEHPELIDTRSVRWDLGLSEDYSLLGSVGVRQERQWGNHRPLLESQVSGRAFEGDGASLGEIYQGAYRLGLDFVDYVAPESSRTEAGLRLGDTIRVSSMSSLAVLAEARQDHSEIKDALEEGSSYQAFSLRSQAASHKDLLIDTKLKRSIIAYRDERKSLEQSQAINEAESLVVARLSPSYAAGLGLRTLDGKRSGPVVTLIRKPDERSEGEAKLSYLKGDGRGELLGSLLAKHQFTRLLSVTLRLEHKIDLFSLYSTASEFTQTSTAQQAITKTYDILWTYTGKLSRIKFSLLSNSQDYEVSLLAQKEAQLAIDTKLNPEDTLIFVSSLRHSLEEGSLIRSVDLRQALIEASWRHEWEKASRWSGAKLFGELGVVYEKLWESARMRERKTFRIAFGQEWI